MKSYNNFFDYIANNEREGCFLINLEGCVVYWDIGMEKITELSFSSVKNQAIWNIQKKLSKERMKHNEESNQYEKIAEIASLKPEEFIKYNQIKEMDIITPSGKIKNISFTLFPFQYHDEKTIAHIVKERECESGEKKGLLEDKNRLSTTLKYIGEGVILINMDSKVLLFNDKAEELTGWKKHEIEGKEVENFILFKENNLNNMLKSRNMEFDHLTLISKNENQIPVSMTISNIKARKEKQGGKIIILRDIALRLKLQQELNKSRKLDSLSILASGIAHDFNNIFAAILGSMNYAKSKISKDNEAYKILTTGEQAIHHAVTLTSQLSSFSKGKMPIKTLSSIKEIIKDSTEFSLINSKIEQEYDFEENLHNVEIDKSQISQVIHNLVINAIQAMESEGKLTIKASNVFLDDFNEMTLPKGNYVKTEIRDEGPGIAPDKIEHIFEPFFTTKNDGTGLGLSICYTIVKKHGGAIKVDSKPEEGAAFTIYLPASDSSQSPINSITNKDTPIKKRVLIMESENFIKVVAGHMLENLKYEVDFRENGSSIIETYKEKNQNGLYYQAVFLNVSSSYDMNGIDTIKELRKINPGIYAVAICEHESDPILINYRKLGFKKVIIKPFKLEDIKNVLY